VLALPLFKSLLENSWWLKKRWNGLGLGRASTDEFFAANDGSPHFISIIISELCLL